MAYLAAPAINWGGNAPQSMTVTTLPYMGVVVPSAEAPDNARFIPAPAAADLVNPTYGHSI